MRSHRCPRAVFVGLLLFCPVLTAGAPGSRPLTQRADLARSGMKLRLPPDWKVGGPRFSNAEELHFVPTDGGRGARIMITTEPRLDHDDAVARLRQIAEEANAPVVFLEIGGWPALQRRQWIDMPLPGKVRPPGDGEKILRITTAVAVGKTLVRLEATVPREREAALADEVEALSRTALFAARGEPAAVEGALRQLREQVPVPPEQPETRAPRPIPQAAPVSEQITTEAPLVLEGEGAAVRALTGGAEISVAVSNNGQNVVVATNSGYTVSSNAGVTFSGLRFPTFPGTYFSVNGDPSLAVGQSGAFYYALIGFPTGSGTTATSNSTAINVSTDNGQNFAFRADATSCLGNTTPGAPGPGLCFADQEHIAADRSNAAPGGDQVYSTWRDFDGSDQDPALVCSQDSGTNWTAKINAGTGTKPRIGVGQDGFVYVVYLNGNNVEIRRYSSCSAGLALQAGFPRVVANIAEVTCPVPGLDRCTGRNTLASYTVSVDDTNANHVYVAFATNTSNNVNENVIVRDSVDGGVNWPRQVQVNGGGNARRFMPWMCTLGGAAHVTWYDRRNATVGNNDLTDFFRGRAFVDAGNNLAAGAEVQLTQVSDPHCASGWPRPTDRITDSESCSAQPQLAGQCSGTGQVCDFSDCDSCVAGACSLSGGACGGNADCRAGCTCPNAEACVVGRGAPKYGDYNYSACAAGRIYSAWASASSPPGIVPATPATRIDTFMNVDLVCCVPRIDAPAALALPATCAGDTSSAPLTVCNTGFTDLAISGISSSNPSQFSVTGPFPATIAAGACQAFSVSFSPPSRGAKAATLTIASNDPVTPNKAVAASGQGQGIVSITCPVDKTVPNDPGQCSAIVNTGVPTYEAEGCPVNLTSLRSDGLPLASPFPVGNTTVTWTATDGGGNAKACPQTIVVNDVEPPVIAGLAAVPNVLWPPNHKMVLVSVNYTATDNCDPTPACSLAISSNEPVNDIGDGNTSPDWLVLDNHHAQLRSERAGGGNGRIYTETVTCEDIYNNSSNAGTAVTVPKSQGKK